MSASPSVIIGINLTSDFNPKTDLKSSYFELEQIFKNVPIVTAPNEGIYAIRKKEIRCRGRQP